MRLKNKVSIITGAGRGIGEIVSIYLAKEGADVVVSDINLDAVTQTAEKIKALGRRSLAIKADVTKSSDVEQMVSSTMKEFGRIDILFNNAGIVIFKPLVELKEEEWDAVINVSLKGTFLCSKAVAKIMINQKSGKIINMSSGAGKIGDKLYVSYSAAKAGVIGFTQALAKELGPYKINVNAVCPSIIHTKMMEKLDKEVGEIEGVPEGKVYERFVKNIPIGREGTPEDVAKLVAFLASSDADYMTGQAINIGGGLIMS